MATSQQKLQKSIVKGLFGSRRSRKASLALLALLVINLMLFHPTAQQHQQSPSSSPTIATSDTPPTPQPQVEGATTALFQVVGVVDGDTIKVQIDGKTETIRLIGIDTPEVVDPRKAVQCYGKEASAHAKTILTKQQVSLQADPTQTDRDKYARLLRYVYLEDGTNFNQQMVARGFAHEYTYDVPYLFQQDFRAAQTAAQQQQLGLWSPNTCDGRP